MENKELLNLWTKLCLKKTNTDLFNYGIGGWFSKCIYSTFKRNIK